MSIATLKKGLLKQSTYIDDIDLALIMTIVSWRNAAQTDNVGAQQQSCSAVLSLLPALTMEFGEALPREDEFAPRHMSRSPVGSTNSQGRVSVSYSTHFYGQPGRVPLLRHVATVNTGNGLFCARLVQTVKCF